MTRDEAIEYGRHRLAGWSLNDPDRIPPNLRCIRALLPSTAIGEPVDGLVTQADRDAATNFNAHVTGGCLRGTEEAELADHFARHRLSAQPTRADNAEVGGLDDEQRAAIRVAAVFLDTAAGMDLEIDGQDALGIVERLQEAFFGDFGDDCFHELVAQALPTAPKDS